MMAQEPKKIKKVPVGVRLSPATAALLREIAHENGTTICQVLEELITQAALPEVLTPRQHGDLGGDSVAADVKHLLSLTALLGEYLAVRIASGTRAPGADPATIHADIRRQMAQINNLARDTARRELASRAPL